MAEEAAFHILQPFCVKVAEQLSVENVTQLQNELEKLNLDQLQALQEYVIFPLKLGLLRDKRPENASLAVVKCLKVVLSSTRVTTWKLFADLLLKLLLIISSPSQQIKVENCSEDLKLSVIECTRELVTRTPLGVRMPMYESDFCPALGHTVFVLLRLSENEGLRSLRVESMRTILQLFALNCDAPQDETDAGSEVIRLRLAAFLPGICIAMAKIATADSKQGQAVTVAALETWTEVVAFCLIAPLTRTIVQESAEAASSERRVPEVQRTGEWVESTAAKLQILLKKILLLVTHSHHKVRLALSNLVGVLLLRCRSYFQDSFVPLLECAISMSSDNSNIVAENNQGWLGALCREELQRPLVDNLEDGIYALTSKLPRILRSAGDKYNFK